MHPVILKKNEIATVVSREKVRLYFQENKLHPYSIMKNYGYNFRKLVFNRMT